MSLLDRFKTTPQEHKARIEAELKKCRTLNEMFTVLNKYYDLDTPISEMLKPITVKKLNENIDKIRVFLGIKER